MERALYLCAMVSEYVIVSDTREVDMIEPNSALAQCDQRTLTSQNSIKISYTLNVYGFLNNDDINNH